MGRPAFPSIDDYLAAQPPAARTVLERVRNAIRKAVPDAEESISYNMPTYKLPGGPVIYFAGWSKHYSLYPISATIIAELKEDLTPYEIEKGAIRFPLDKPVPVKLIASIAKIRAKEAAARPKKAASKKR